MSNAISIALASREDCTDEKCALWARCQHSGIGGRALRIGDKPSDECILVVGQSPGYHEDQAGAIFIGRSGQILEQWYLKFLPQGIDIWATNAVKCIPPYKSDPVVKNIRACNGYLADDIRALQQAYSRVWVLCLGRIAAHAVLGTKKLTGALGSQAKIITQLPWGGDLLAPVTVCSTQHPAAIMRNPKESLVNAVKDHLRLFADTITGRVGGNDIIHVFSPDEFLRQLDYAKPTIVSVDIETYGIRPWAKQTVFHPRLSALIDGVPIGRQIVSTAFAFRYPDSVQIGTTAFFIHRHVGAVEAVIRWVQRHAASLLGTNIPFDLGYIGAHWPALVPLIALTRLLDLVVLSFCQNPDRPESSSLKVLAPLFLRGDVAKYQERGTQYGDDAALLEYNRQDVVNPILLYELLLRRMKQEGLPPRPELLLDHYSDVLHTLLHMTMVGVTFDQIGIAQAYAKWAHRVEKFESDTLLERGFSPAGKGSQAAIRGLFNQAVAESGSSEWELSEKTGIVSTGKSNMRRALASLKLMPATRKALRALQHYRTSKKLVSSYLEPMLHLVSYDKTVYPSWFPVPSRFDVADDEGGTRQGRVVCRHPALQTAPPEIKCHMRSRYPRGTLVSYDYSQLELRILALVSGDEELLRVFENDLDIHQETLDFISRRPVSKSEPQYDRLRRQAKYTNFGVVYGISPPGLREVWWKYAGINAPEAEAARFINGFRTKYKRVPELHHRFIAEVEQTGHLVLPVTGAWLSFADPRQAGELDKAILNYPIQYMAATLCLIAQGEIIRMLTEGGAGVSPLNVYDAIHVDYRERVSVLAYEPKVVATMCDNWYIHALEEHYGRRVPLKVDAKVLSA